jgi:putative transposase
MPDLQGFDPSQSFAVVWRRLPHWAQTGTICFLTWRTADSMPRDIVALWISQRNALLAKVGIRVDEAGFGDNGWHWKRLVTRLPKDARWSLQCDLTDRFDEQLDACQAECLLRKPELATIVGNCLRKFDGTRYELTDFIVMPNHVHLLVAFRDEDGLLRQCAAWKRYSARAINRVLGRQGDFWQEESFDHLVRSESQFEHYRGYIGTNGRRANLPATDYLHYSRK